MAQRHQRGWLKKEKRAQGETWVLFFRTTRQSHGKRVENKVPIGLVRHLPEGSAWAEVERLHVPINRYQIDQERGLIVIDSPEVGLVAVLPVGMCFVSSVNLTPEVGARLQKGDEFGFFLFGGSDIVNAVAEQEGRDRR